MTASIRDQLQTTLGDAYQLERELGGGGMSRVFVAVEARLQRRVVVKVLSPELAHGMSVERFEREIRTAAALQQANIVPVLSAGDADGLPYYIMPFVEGESLRARLGRGPLSIAESVSILRDVARALSYAHGHGVVHRDIKPDNVLLSGHAAVVTDFGIAKAISASRTAAGQSTLTQVGTAIGTPAYMAPEQAAGDPNVDHRADVYAFGCMAYELLAGRPPFSDASPRGILAAHLSEVARPVMEHRPDVPEALAALVSQCLAKEPTDRPAGADALLDALDRSTSVTTPASRTPASNRVRLRTALAIYTASFVVAAALAWFAITTIGLPDWVFPGTVIVMALGLPVVLWTGYAQRVARKAASAPTTPGGTPSVGTGALTTMALRAAPHVSWHRTARGGAMAMGVFVLLVIAFMASRAFGIGPAATLFSTGALTDRDGIVMADFTTTSGDTSLGRVVSFAVRTALEQSPVLTLVSDARVAGTLDLMGRTRSERMDLALARQVATREGAKAVVDGEVATVGTGYVLTIRLITADSARVLASFQEAGEGPSGLIEAADKVARALRGKAGESLRTVQASAPLWRARTASLEALKAYSQGVYYHQVVVDNQRALPHYRQALSHDSLFAEAWRRLGVVMANQGNVYSRTEIDSALSRAHTLRNRVGDRERAMIEGTYFGMSGPGSSEAGPGRDRVKAIAAYTRYQQFNLGNQLESRREFARAESVFRAHAVADTTFALAFGSLARVLVSQGKLGERDSLMEQSRRYFPRNPLVARGVVDGFYHRGKVDEFERLTDSAASAGVPMGNTREELALLRGRLDAWRTMSAQRLQQADSAAKRPISLVARVRNARILQQLGASSAAREWEEVDRYLAEHPTTGMAAGDRPDLAVAQELALAGRVAQAKGYLSSYLETVRDTSLLRWNQPAVNSARAAIALAEKRYRDAIRDFRRGDSLPDGPVTSCSICLPLMLARVFDAANEPDSAIAELEKYLNTPYQGRLSTGLDASSLPLARERLGQLYEAKENIQKALENYQAFVDLWKNPDPELRPAVVAARERIRRLTPVEPR